ncbi:hypothetical protein HYQ46_010089 [Verticillium longisporum]|nr:hypothetical protein HYQ46_010089 [Verticillium longisporum]
MMQKVLAQMDDMQKEGKEQQATIQELQRLLLESQQQDQETRRQLQDTKQQLKEVREQLEAIMKFPGMTSSTHSNAQASYAEVARTPPTSQPTNVRTLSSMNTTPSTFTDTLFCTVDTSRVEEADRSKVHAGSVRVAVEKEMRTRREDDSWRCKAVTVDTKNANRIKIVCRDEAEHNMVKQAAERMELASGVRVSRDELYPVKVDNVNRTAVLDESGSIRLGAAQAFGQENEATVAKVSWLSKRDIPKAYGSMVVYLTKAADARRVLQEGYFHAGGESGKTEELYESYEFGEVNTDVIVLVAPAFQSHCILTPESHSSYPNLLFSNPLKVPWLRYL